MADPGWWTNFFEGQALEHWRHAYTRDESRGQAADIARALCIAPGERLLDVPCGNGRLALELANRGTLVSALDASEDLLSEARRTAVERGLEVEFRRGDMRALPWNAEFDAVLCAGNSFGYFDEEGNQAFLAAVARVLRPGGRFLLEYPLVAELVLARRAFRDWHRLGERLLLSESHYDAGRGRLETDYTFADLTRAGEAFEHRSASYRVYSAHEIETGLQRAGFTSIELLGALEGARFEESAGEFHVRAVRA